VWPCVSSAIEQHLMSNDRSYPTRPIIGVGVVVLRGEEVLLIKRGKPPRIGQWSLPGGMQELGETAAEAAHREVLEETGIKIKLGQVLDIIDIIRPDDDGRIETHYTLIDYAAEYASGIPRAGDDALHAEFVALSKIKELGMWEETIRVIELASVLSNENRHVD
jgi:8-oxo-dGTP diphosphatase